MARLAGGENGRWVARGGRLDTRYPCPSARLAGVRHRATERQRVVRVWLSSQMPVGRIDDEDEERLVDESLQTGLLAPPSDPAGGGGGGGCRPLCFGAMVMGLLAFGGSAVLATRIYDEGHTGTTGVCKNYTCSLVFVAGGCTACDDSIDGQQYHPTLGLLEAYDAATASWNTSYPPMPTPRAMLGLASLNDVLYAIGGTPGGNATGPCPTAAGKPCTEPKYPSGTVEMFDPLTRQWTQGRPLTTPRWGLSVAASDGVIYAMGGYAKKPAHALSLTETDAETERTGLGEVYAVASPVNEVLNPAQSDGWTRKANMLVATVFASAAVLPYDGQGVVFVTGGRNSSSPSMTYMEAYFPRNDSWVEKAPMPVGRSSHASAVVNGKLYVLGGRTSQHKTMLRTVDEYLLR